MWSLSSDDDDITHYQPRQEDSKVVHSGRHDIEQAQAHGFYSLLYLTQALDGLTSDIQITVLSNQMQAVTGQEELCPEKGVTVEPIELTNTQAAMFDIALAIIEVEQPESVAAEASDGGLQLNLTYKADFFSAQLLAQYQNLLEQPEIRLFDLIPKERGK